MTLSVLILVCAAAVAPGDCDAGTARVVMTSAAPGVVACGLQGQALPAETVTVGPDEYVKVVCRGR